MDDLTAEEKERIEEYAQSIKGGVECAPLEAARTIASLYAQIEVYKQAFDEVLQLAERIKARATSMRGESKQ